MMTKPIIALLALVVLFAVLGSSQLDVSTRSSIAARQVELVDVETVKAEEFKPIIDINQFIPRVPDEQLYPGADLNNNPEDEEVSSVPADNDIPYIIPINIAAQKMVSYTLDGKIYEDSREISLINPISRIPIRDITDFEPIEPRIDPRFPININPGSQMETICATDACAGLYTSLNLSSLSTSLMNIMRPILSSFNNKNVIVRSSWPHVDFTIVAVTINSINISSSNGKVTIYLAVSATGKLHVRTKLLGSATTTFNIVNYAITATANVSRANNKVALTNVAVTAGYNDLNIHTSGGLIMKFVIKVASTLLKVKTLCRNILTDTVPNALKNALSTLALNLVNSIPWKLKTGKWGAGLNLKVVDLDTQTANNVVVGFSAETINFSTGAPFAHNVATRNSIKLNPNPNHLFSIMVEQFTINDYVSTWFSQQSHVNLYSKTTRPQWLTDLNTMAWNIIFPGIGDNHPNADLVMKVELSQAPFVNINGAIATFKAQAVATWAIDNGMGQIGEPLVSIKLDLSTGLTMSMKYDQVAQVYALVPTITNISPQFSPISTVIGPIDMTKVNETLNNIINMVVVPLVDLVLLDGIAIPTTKNFQIVSPTISFVNKAVLVGAGANIQF